MKLRIAAILVLLALADAGTARAGTYTVNTCKDPGGGLAAISWTIEKRYATGYFSGNACPGGYFWLDLLGNVQHPGDDYTRATLLAPADTRITAYALRRSVQLSSPYHYDFHEINANGGFDVRETCFGDAGCPGLGDHRNADAPGNLIKASGRPGLSGLSFSIYCRNATPGPACPTAAPAANLQLHGGEVTLTDQTPPTLMLPPSGPLLDASKPLAGRQQVFIWATDRGGGVRDVRFEVDGTVVDSATIDLNGGRCRDPFSYAQPCKLEARGPVTLDTAKLSDGKHQLRLLVADATGTNAATWGPVTIETANGTCETEPPSDALKLSAAFAASSRARVRAIGYTQQPRVRGRVARPDGTPAGGISVCVAEREDAPNAPLRSVQTVTTDEHGAFRYTLPRGPSRRVSFVARVDGGAVSDSLRVRVRAGAQLRASRRSLRNGQLLTLSGKLFGGPVPHMGVLVELQARREQGWQTFGTTRTTPSGRYRYRYRFAYTTGVMRYRFRARVRAQAAYPYTSGTSRTIPVTVRG
jgi:hypothetical protein